MTVMTQYFRILIPFSPQSLVIVMMDFQPNTTLAPVTPITGPLQRPAPSLLPTGRPKIHSIPVPIVEEDDPFVHSLLASLKTSQRRNRVPLPAHSRRCRYGATNDTPPHTISHTNLITSSYFPLRAPVSAPADVSRVSTPEHVPKRQ